MDRMLSKRARLSDYIAKIKTKLRKKNDEQFIFKKIAHRAKVAIGIPP
jgi:hypothetical protein